MLTAIENAKKLVTSPAWPRPINNFPRNSNLNCWGFALDGLKIPVLQKLTWYSDPNGLDTKIFDFLQAVGLNPRIISTPEEKSPDEIVFLFYIFKYEYSNIAQEIWEKRLECHVARIERNGTVVEKADSTEEPVITSLEEIKQRILSENDLVDPDPLNPIFIAVQKP